MTNPEKAALPLFVYGTLLSDDILVRVVGRIPLISPAILNGYACYYVNGAMFPGIIREPGSAVPGHLLQDLTETEVEMLDAYEDDFYQRLTVEVSSEDEAQRAEAYVVPEGTKSVLSNQLWTWDEFKRQHLKYYLKAMQIA